MTRRSTAGCGSPSCWTPKARRRQAGSREMADNGHRSDRDQVLDELRGAEKLVVVTHENPDGDALGSLAAMRVFLDCGNLERNPAEVFRRPGMRILDIDHHHDNTRFGTVNLVVPQASCTAEIVWDLMRGLEVSPTLTIAEALYVGLITDTGRFMYENTGKQAHLMAAELIDAGVDVHDI